MLSVNDLTIKFKKPIFNQASFSCAEGQIISIYGESGCGKTTLLKFITGEVDYQSGELFYNDIKIDSINRDDFLFNVVSYIDQVGCFFPNMTIYNHFQFYGELHDIKVDKEIVLYYLKIVHLEHVSFKNIPSQLSTGERKRFLLALAIMMKKKIIIIDEPTASLDKNNIDSLWSIIQELSKNGVMFILTTHDQFIIDKSDLAYEIRDLKLVGSNQNLKREKTLSVGFIKPKKVRYSHFKNIKLRIIFVAILLVGGLGLAFVSRTFASHMSLKSVQSSELQNYLNDQLYLMKSIDPRYVIENKHLLDDSINRTGWADVFSQQELDKIKSIDGVVDVVPTFECLKNRQDDPIEIYQNGKLLKNVSVKACTYNNLCYNRDIVITAYYPQENIKKDGKQVSGVYIDEILAQILDVSSYKDMELSFVARYYTGLSYDKSMDLPSLKVHDSLNNVKIKIDGVLTNIEYNDGRFGDYGRIYMPVDIFKKFVKDSFPYSSYKKPEMSFQPLQYMIMCEEGKDEIVKLEIEKLNDLYYATSSKMTQKDFVNHVARQNQSALMMSVGMITVFMGAFILLVAFYNTMRSKELPRLSQEGLTKYILSYYKGDHICMLVGWFIISLVCMCFMLYYFEVIKDSSFVQNYIIVWTVTTLSIGLLVIMLKIFMLKLNIKKIDKR